MTTSTSLSVLALDSPNQAAILDSIVNLHASCILNDHTLATFIPPLSHSRMKERWLHFLDEIGTGRRIIVVHVSRVSERAVPPYDVELPFASTKWPQISHEVEVSGTVSLSMPESETGPFRGLVQNLFISPYHRRKGIASKLLAELEKQALLHTRWNLMLDTMEGSTADSMYTNLGWERLGVVKNFGISPKDGRLLNEVFFWKDIRPAEEK